jgi:hypothetical protein
MKNTYRTTDEAGQDRRAVRGPERLAVRPAPRRDRSVDPARLPRLLRLDLG